MKINWFDEKENLEKMIQENVSYCEIGRNYGVSSNTIKKACKKLGIELKKKRQINPNEHFNKGKAIKEKVKHVCLNCGCEFEHSHSSTNKFCSTKCSGEYRQQKHVELWLNGECNGLSGEYNLSHFIRKYLLKKSHYKCEKCGWGERNEYTQTIPLEIHHIDGNYTNNNLDNLQVLCPNCHSLTDNYKSHNKSGRRGRKKYN